MNKENCALKLVDEIILYYDARSKKHQGTVIYQTLKILRENGNIYQTPRKVLALRVTKLSRLRERKHKQN